MSESSEDNFDHGPEAKRPLYLPKIEPFVADDGRVVFIDRFLSSAKGRQKMNSFISTIDSGTDIAQTVQFLRNTEADCDDKKVLQLLLSNQGRLGFTREELASAYVDNPAMNKTMRYKQLAHHDGAVDAEKLYQDMLLVLGNISRYEMLCGVHNPTSDTWEARAARVLHYRGHEFVQHLPTRFRHPDND